jgi:hypothetical protein
MSVVVLFFSSICSHNKIKGESCVLCNFEGIDFEETFSSVVRLEDIKMFLAFACFKNFKVYQMDVKSNFSMVI